MGHVQKDAKVQEFSAKRGGLSQKDAKVQEFSTLLRNERHSSKKACRFAGIIE
ncbi:hypothetical protein J25TS5_08850 [Paenibacillus faecis]|uniref:hypothetical protein n=1 Tax=Paenibacillus faecis TaxID=862114 RepID=UPI001B067867|nr:hypothetical protein [Paenibacillus faecis]GIO83953.1 hypothetical protein J25TS5_08850 [Paenibacillus faecis]